MHIDDVDHVWATTYNERQVGPIDDVLPRPRPRRRPRSPSASASARTSRATRSCRATGAIETLDELQRRGFKRGVISVCSSDVEELWDETELAGARRRRRPVVRGRIVEARSADLRARVRPARRASPASACSSATARTTSSPARERVGMRAVCVLPPGRDEPIWPEARGWEPTITSLDGGSRRWS